MDDETYDVLQKLELSNIKLMALREYETSEKSAGNKPRHPNPAENNQPSLARGQE